jgi:hypothetical protein
VSGLVLASLGAVLLLGGEPHSDKPPVQTDSGPAVIHAALSAPVPEKTAQTSPAVTARRTRSIEDVRVGDRVEAGNPEGAADEAPVDPESWVKLELTLSNPDDTVDVVLLRPRVWAEAVGARVGSHVALDLPEMGASGRALVTAVGPCPPLKPGNGRIVTGTFRHRSARVLDLALEGSDETIGVTANHPFWSEDRRKFVPAGELKPGERLRTLEGEARVASLAPRAGEQAVYNIEVHAEHVYRVTTAGILVHNDCIEYAKAWVERNGKGTAYHMVPNPAMRSEFVGVLPKFGPEGWRTHAFVVVKNKLGQLRFYDQFHKGISYNSWLSAYMKLNSIASMEEMMQWVRIVPL